MILALVVILGEVDLLQRRRHIVEAFGDEPGSLLGVPLFVVIPTVRRHDHFDRRLIQGIHPHRELVPERRIRVPGGSCSLVDTDGSESDICLGVLRMLPSVDNEPVEDAVATGLVGDPGDLIGSQVEMLGFLAFGASTDVTGL